MPSIPLMQIPESRSADESQSMCKDVLTNEYGVKFKRYGKMVRNKMELIFMPS